MIKSGNEEKFPKHGGIEEKVGIQSPKKKNMSLGMPKGHNPLHRIAEARLQRPHDGITSGFKPGMGDLT